jgi:hypothetical protein
MKIVLAAIALIAASMAGAGGAVAVTQITSADIKDESVRTGDIRDDTLRSRDVRDWSLRLRDLSPQARQALGCTTAKGR